MAIYLAEGFNCAARISKSRYEALADTFGGHVGIMHRLAELAFDVAEVVAAAGDKFDFPGVWEYEVGHELGVRFFVNPETTNEEFKQLAEMATDEWIAKNAQNRPN